ncbi:50S ribosomal protein L30 [Membranihabitans marinus]|uniref:50S ribosomal protein L30 n=1 Tax=Membranihabitans marinus TaxID=1227546 RepID=UPI001F02FF6D|nr:50S ribosomal protein L30 [Membranihabitans marinus]
MAKVQITQVKSAIDRSKKQKATLQALGLRKINASVEHELNSNIKGMIDKVAHLVEVVEK